MRRLRSPSDLRQGLTASSRPAARHLAEVEGEIQEKGGKLFADWGGPEAMRVLKLMG